MEVQPRRALKIGAVALFTTFILLVVFFNTSGKGIADLDLIHIIELFVAIPLLTIVYYLLLASKYDEFNERFNSVEDALERIIRKLESEEKTLRKDESRLTFGERELKREIADLHRVLRSLDKDVSMMKKLVK